MSGTGAAKRTSVAAEPGNAVALADSDHGQSAIRVKGTGNQVELGRGVRLAAFDIDVKGLPQTLTIDFNRAYNPNCARSPHYNCPVAMETLPVALRAGEKIPPKH